MATREDFSQEAWQLIVSSPSLVGLAVSAASPSGTLGMVKEMLAVGAAASDLAEQAPDNRLIDDVLEDVRSGAVEELHPQDVSNLEEARAWSIAELRRLRSILDESGAGSDGEELRQWLVEVAGRVAAASREGGILGLGGTRVSDTEGKAIAEIRQALGV